MNNLGDLVATILLDAWTVIASFVVLSLLVVRLVRTGLDGRTLDSLLSRRGVGPFGGAALGAIPGCGGAIAVVSLYGRGTAGFGTLLAALIATAGDSAFVLLTVAPRTAALTYGVAFSTGVVAGVVVDGYDLALTRLERVGHALDEPDDGVNLADGGTRHDAGWEPVTGALRTATLVGWWFAAVVGVTVGLSRAVGGDVPRTLTAGQPVGVVTVVSAVGVALSVGVALLPDRLLRTPERGGIRAAVSDTAVESAPIVTWIVVALAGYRTLVTVLDIGTPEAVLCGPLGAITGALIGAIPGCGVHVGLVTAFAEGAVPLSTLVANAISQDGDALFALFAIDRTAAVVATVYTVVPAIAVGLVVWVI
jgi:hypothetical protein